MGELVSLHIGGAGIGIGNATWRTYCGEHGIGPDGTSTGPIGTPSVLFRETRSGAYRARCLFLDSDYIDKGQRVLSCGGVVAPSAYVTSIDGSACTFSRGRGRDRPHVRTALDYIRKEVEACDAFSGFLVTNSGAGGTGSGLTSEILSQLSVEYGKKSKATVTLTPTVASDGLLAPYNFVFHVEALLEHSDMAVLLDNRSVERLCEQRLGDPRPSMALTNEIIANVAASMSAAMRLPASTAHTSLQTLTTNLAPYPRIHFLLPSLSGLLPASRVHRQPLDCLLGLVREAFNHERILSTPAVNKFQRVMASCSFFRGGPPGSGMATTTALRSVFTSLVSNNKKDGVLPVAWAPTGVHSVSVDPPRWGSLFPPVQHSAVTLMNTAAVENVFRAIDHPFDLMYSKRALVYSYVNDGLSESEFCEARENIAALEKDYECENYWGMASSDCEE